MIWGDDLIGILGVERDSEDDKTLFTDSDVRVLSLVARLGTSSMNNTILLQRLRRFNEQLLCQVGPFRPKQSCRSGVY